MVGKIYHKKSDFVEEWMGKNLIVHYKFILIADTVRHLRHDLFSYSVGENSIGSSKCEIIMVPSHY